MAGDPRTYLPQSLARPKISREMKGYEAHFKLLVSLRPPGAKLIFKKSRHVQGYETL